MKSSHLQQHGSRECNVNQNKSDRDRQIVYDFSHKWNLGNKTRKKKLRNQKTDS